MQSQKVTRSTARHLRRKRMNLARKKLSEESLDTSLIINNNSNSKSIKDSINRQIVESLDCSTTIKSGESSTKKNKNSKKSQMNIKEQKPGSETTSGQSEKNNSKHNSTKKEDKKDNKKEDTKEDTKQEVPKKSEPIHPEVPAETVMVTQENPNPQTNPSLPGEIRMSSAKSEGPPKSKAELRAERRAIQEAQRALKAQAKAGEKKEKPPGKKPPGSKPEPKPAAPKKGAKPNEVNSEKKAPKKVEHYVSSVFSHLIREKSNIENLLNSDIHPMFLKLGVKYAEGKAVGSNCRCEALLFALRRFIKVYEAPEQQDFVRGLEMELNKTVEFLDRCRPLSVTMQNALKKIRGQMSMVKSTESDEEVRKMLRETLMTYIREQIWLAGEAICRKMLNRINDGDVILTYGHSTLARKALIDAQESGKKFQVIVVDSRPRLEGKFLVSQLVKHDIDCTYIMISALSFVLPQVTMVVMGAHSILANGAIMARVGTAQVALMSKDANIPVMILSEMNKCDDRALTDSIVYNELDNSDALIKTFDDSKPYPLSNWRSKRTLNLLNLAYDVTPANFITAVITELAIMPSKSIPVALRVKPWEV